VFENQLTLKKKITFNGLGLHCGLPIKMTVLPSEIDTGIYFVRTDLKKSLPIEANWKNIIPANLCTKISNKKNQYVSTIEHLMFALYSLGISNALIEVNGPEVPIMDGSAKIFIEELLKNGLLEQNKKNKKIKIFKTFEVKIGNKHIIYQPASAEGLEIDYVIKYNDQFIKEQSFILKNAQTNFLQVYDSRTFCHQEDLEKIFAMGLAKGGSLENAIVISANKILNQEGLRYQNEFVRHKVLDCLGDLYLCNFFLSGKIICKQGGHELTSLLLAKIFENDKYYTVEDFTASNNDQTTKKSGYINRVERVVSN